MFAKDDLWVVVDRIEGAGRHRARLHWLGGPYPWAYDAPSATLRLETGAGPFAIRTFDADANPLAGDVVAGSDEPPRGWLSRHYGEKLPAPSLAVEVEADAPIQLVSVLGAGSPTLAREGASFRASSAGASLAFDVVDGRIVPRAEAGS